MIYTRTMIALQKELHERYEVAATIRHRGEKGRKREHGLGMFLRENLPERYGVATGEVIPYRGDTPSPQCDIIIYDRATCPVIGKTSVVQQVPLEGVYSVIEVKSHITRAALNDALANFEIIRSLPRCKLNRKPKRGAVKRPLFVLFGYELKTTEDACLDFFKHGVNEDIFLIALDKGFTAWIERSKDDIYPVFWTATDAESGIYETLALSFATYLDELGGIDLGEPSYKNMMASWK
jgi:uncharacterized protein DUF6602